MIISYVDAFLSMVLSGFFLPPSYTTAVSLVCLYVILCMRHSFHSEIYSYVIMHCKSILCTFLMATHNSRTAFTKKKNNIKFLSVFFCYCLEYAHWWNKYFFVTVCKFIINKINSWLFGHISYSYEGYSCWVNFFNLFFFSPRFSFFLFLFFCFCLVLLLLLWLWQLLWSSSLFRMCMRISNPWNVIWPNTDSITHINGKWWLLLTEICYVTISLSCCHNFFVANLFLVWSLLFWLDLNHRKLRL